MASATTSATQTPVSTPLVNPDFVFPSPVSNHNRSHSLMGQSKSPNDFVFPRRPPSTSNLARPRSSAADASTLLAEIGVLPPPPGPPSGNRLRHPPTPYYPNGVRPVSMIATPPMPSVTLSPAPGGRLGHRRGASELIGDKPTEFGEGNQKKVPSQNAGPGLGTHKRGHAHRRSGAISSSDIWGLLSQSAPSLPLAQTSPNKDIREGAERRGSDGGEVNSKASPVLSWSAPVSPGFVSLSSTVPPVPALDPNITRRSARVAFTDRVEIIPRPLSTSTIGSGLTGTQHQGAESITSVGSFGSPASRSVSTVSGRSRSNSISSKTSPLSPELLQEITQRPSTAGAILASPGPRCKPAEVLPTIRTSINTLQPNPDPMVRPAPKPKHKKALSDSSPHSSPTIPVTHNELFETGTSPTMSKKSKKGGKRKKKKQIKSWIFGARVLGKHSKSNSELRSPKRSPTPPPARSNSVERRKSGDGYAPGWTESYVLMPEGSMAGRSLEELSSTMSPRYNSFGSGDSPIIDLDAALAPLNSPSLALGTKVKAFSVAKRTMHSSGAGGKMSIGSGIGSGIGAGAFGAGYIGSHRRSESMPEMPLFTLSENDRMVMDDVFEEEEEEYEDDSESEESEDESVASGSRTEGLGIGIKVVDEEGVTSWEEGLKMDWSVREQSSSSTSNQVPVRRGSLAPSLSKGSLRSESILEEDEPEEPIVDRRQKGLTAINFGTQKGNESPPSPGSCATPTSALASAQSSTSTVTPLTATSSSPPLAPSVSSSSICNTVNTESPSSAPSTPHLAPHSTPGNPYATPTIKELAAIVAQEDEFDPYADSPLHFLGEPGPEMRMSVDDVPSLTSSSSTMTSSYAAYCLAAQPSTPRTVEESSMTINKKSKSSKRKWSRMLKFWEAKKGKS